MNAIPILQHMSGEAIGCLLASLAAAISLLVSMRRDEARIAALRARRGVRHAAPLGERQRPASRAQ